MLITAVLFLTSLSKSYATCNTYACGSLSSTCMTTVNNLITYDSSKCNSTSVCSANSLGYGSCVLSTDTSGMLPGRKCSQASYCLSGVCTNGVCKGLSVGATCSDTTYCDVGLYCNSATSMCATLRTLGQSCVNFYDCTYYTGCNNGVCVGFFTLANGASLSSGLCQSSTFTSIQPVCQSGMCFLSTTGAATCGAAVTYSGGDLIQCSASSACTVTYGGISNSFTCYCGWSAAGTSYCSLTVGSSAGQAYLTVAKSIYSSSIAKNCHVEEDDLNIAMDYGTSALLAQVAYRKWNFVFGAMMHNALSCVVQSNMGYLYSSYSSYSFGEVIGVGIAFIIFGC